MINNFILYLAYQRYNNTKKVVKISRPNQGKQINKANTNFRGKTQGPKNDNTFIELLKFFT